jgi:predicted membrane channel-forming protein YqfA (hemolysin III family)
MAAVSSSPSPGWRYRAAVASRALAALGGGYLLAAAVAAACAVYLPLQRAEATIIGVMFAFIVYACSFMAAFVCRSAWHAWTWILGPALLLGSAVLLPRWF